MKRIFLLASLAAAFLAPGITKAQTDIPNGDFETWTTTTVPANWTVVSGAASRITGVSYFTTNQSTGVKTTVYRPVYDGMYGMQLSNTVVGTTASLGIVTNKFPLTSRPAFFAMNLAYFPGIQGESPQVVVFAYKYNMTTKKRDTVLFTGQLGNPNATFMEPWTQNYVDLSGYYKNSNTPDSALILISCTGTVNGQTTQNTVLFVEKAWLASSQPAGVPMMATNKVSNGLVYPNPFTATTTIHYNLTENGQVTLNVYDVTGKQVATVVNENQTGGGHDVKFDGSDLKNGVYFYRLQAGNSTQTGKLILNK
jgi:hypothetical protein